MLAAASTVDGEASTSCGHRGGSGTTCDPSSPSPASRDAKAKSPAGADADENVPIPSFTHKWPVDMEDNPVVKQSPLSFFHRHLSNLVGPESFSNITLMSLLGFSIIEPFAPIMDRHRADALAHAKAFPPTSDGRHVHKMKEGMYRGKLTAAGRRTGFGIMDFPDGSRYEGHWNPDKNKYQGVGNYTWATGENYLGHFVAGTMQGRGRYRWADGYRHYDGYFSVGKRFGRGTISWHMGVHYTGYFADDSFNGDGLILWNDHRWFLGHFDRGSIDGFGVLMKSTNPKFRNKDILPDPNRAVIRSTFRNATTVNMAKGEMLWADGRHISSCTFVENEALGGDCHLRLPSGEEYVGTMVQNMMNGQGVLTSRPPRTSNVEGYTLRGSFSNDQAKGMCEMNYSSHRRNVGQFDRGVSHGEGVLWHPNGAVYIGNFNQGRYEGKGIYYAGGGPVYVKDELVDAGTPFEDLPTVANAKYAVFKGDFKANQYDGEGELSLPPNGETVYTGGFRKGRYHGVGRLEARRTCKRTDGTWKEGVLTEEAITTPLPHCERFEPKN